MNQTNHNNYTALFETFDQDGFLNGFIGNNIFAIVSDLEIFVWVKIKSFYVYRNFIFGSLINTTALQRDAY